MIDNIVHVVESSKANCLLPVPGVSARPILAGLGYLKRDIGSIESCTYTVLKIYLKSMVVHVLMQTRAGVIANTLQ